MTVLLRPTLAALAAVCLLGFSIIRGDEPTDAVHDQLRKLRDELVRAVNAKEGPAVLAALHPNVVLTAQDGQQLRAVRGRDGVRDYLDRLLLGPDRGVEKLVVAPTVDELSLLYHGNTAIAFGSSQDHYQLVDGTEFDLSTRWSATLIKDGDQWLVANLHVSTNLFENPVLAALTRLITWVAIVCGIVGLAVGAIAATFLRRRSSG